MNKLLEFDPKESWKHLGKVIGNKPENWVKMRSIPRGKYDNIYTHLLIIGGTGTLGRQIVLQALKKGYQVYCLVRDFKKARFLRKWGAKLIYGDLKWPHSFPRILKGITAVIDASTNRVNEPDDLTIIDYEAKLIFIEIAKASEIKHFIFFSSKKYKRFLPFAKSRGIPLLKVKLQIEDELINSGIPYTIFRITGFYQGLIEEYAIPILENLPLWVTDENAKVSFLDTQDIAKFCLRSLQLPYTRYQTFILSGLKKQITSEMICICEQLAGQSAKIRKIPLFFLTILGQILGFFEWSQNIGDRLAFAELLDSENEPLESVIEVYKIFKVDPTEITQIDDYFLEYFIRLLKRLRDINFEDIQKQKNLIL